MIANDRHGHERFYISRTNQSKDSDFEIVKGDLTLEGCVFTAHQRGETYDEDRIIYCDAMVVIPTLKDGKAYIGIGVAGEIELAFKHNKPVCIYNVCDGPDDEYERYSELKCVKAYEDNHEARLTLVDNNSWHEHSEVSYDYAYAIDSTIDDMRHRCSVDAEAFASNWLGYHSHTVKGQSNLFPDISSVGHEKKAVHIHKKYMNYGCWDVDDVVSVSNDGNIYTSHDAAFSDLGLRNTSRDARKGEQGVILGFTEHNHGGTMVALRMITNGEPRDILIGIDGISEPTSSVAYEDIRPKKTAVEMYKDEYPLTPQEVFEKVVPQAKANNNEMFLLRR